MPATNDGDHLAPGRFRPATLPHDDPPRLAVFVATEEEFDWQGGFDRGAVSTTAIDGLELGQRVFDEFGVRPTYGLDYPVAEQHGALFRRLHGEGRVAIGSHLHPWVNPPHDEQVDNHNSYPSHLPPELERAKLAALTDRIELEVGVRPRVYQAGRFGIGPHSLRALAELGYRVDVSVAPPFDYRYLGGPDYSTFPCELGWAAEPGGLLCAPVTGAFVGRLGAGARTAYRLATHPRLGFLRMPGILSRSGLLDRLRLSPEGFEAKDMMRLVRFLARRGERAFTFYFHSTSLVAGHTEFVRSDADRERFFDETRRFLDFFLGPFGGVAATHEEVWERAVSSAGERAGASAG